MKETLHEGLSWKEKFFEMEKVSIELQGIVERRDEQMKAHFEESTKVLHQNEVLANTMQSMQEELTMAKADSECLFKALQLFARMLISSRIRVREMQSHKDWMNQQLYQVDIFRRELLALQVTHGVTSPPKKSLRPYILTVMAIFRFRHFAQHPLLGKTFNIGKLKFTLAPPQSIETVTDIPSMSTSKTELGDVENAALLLNHFEPENSLETSILQPQIEYLSKGTPHKTNNNKSNYSLGSFLSWTTSFFASKIRQSEMHQQLAEREREEFKFSLERETARASDMEKTLSKSVNLSVHLENKLQQIQEQVLKALAPITFEKLLKAHKDYVSTRHQEDPTYKARLEKQMLEQLSVASELLGELPNLKQEMTEKSEWTETLEAQAEANITKLEQTSRQLKQLEEERNHLKTAIGKDYKELLETQTKLKVSLSEKENLKKRLENAESESLMLRRKTINLETIARQLENEKKTIEEKLSTFRMEYEGLVTELEKYQEIAKTLQEVRSRMESEEDEVDERKARTQWLKSKVEGKAPYYYYSTL
jgi:hypothetical protein